MIIKANKLSKNSILSPIPPRTHIMNCLFPFFNEFLNKCCANSEFIKFKVIARIKDMNWINVVIPAKNNITKTKQMKVDR